MLTNYKQLTFAITSNGNAYTPREQIQFAFISEFTTDVRHIKGKHNVVADALSQVDIAALKLPGVEQIDFSAIAKHQL